MYADRLPYLKELERLRDSRVLVYVTGDRPGMETQIHSEVLDYFADQLDSFGLPRKISLYLYSRGGETLTGWSIVNLIRHFCDEFEVIIPSKARSTATLIALGADRIVMTKQATLGPIDPSINGPLNPQMPGAPQQQRVPVSVEDAEAYFELASSHGIRAEAELTRVFEKLASEVHPLALGSLFRARSQIQRLATRLLQLHISDELIIQRIVAVLCNEAGSHDYTINRREAENDLRLPIVKPDDELYEVIRALQDDIRTELCLNQRFEPAFVVGGNAAAGYECPRALVESVSGGSDRMISRGVINALTVNGPAGPQPAFMDQRQFEGWEHEPARTA